MQSRFLAIKPNQSVVKINFCGMRVGFETTIL